jgi:hypothetical protein
MKQLVLGLFLFACGHSPTGSPSDAMGDGSVADGSLGDVGGGADAAWMDVSDPPDLVAAPCSTLLGFPSVPLVIANSLNAAPVAVDVDGDLRADLIEAAGSSVTVRHGIGDGTFGDPDTYPVGTNPSGLVVVDLDGDHKPEIVTANLQSNTLSVLHNLGAAGFAVQVTYATDGGPRRLASGDLDGDHAVDLVVANEDGHTLGVYLNHGDGTFAAAVTYATGTFTSGLAIADVLGDSKPDVVTTDVAGTVSMFVNSGSGVLAAPVTLATDAQPSGLAIANVAGDSKLDIVVSEQTTDGHLELGTFTNLGASFSTRQDYPVGGTASPASFVLGDFNGDGYLDAAFPAGVIDTIDTLGISFGTPAGGFGAAVLYRSWSIAATAAADLDADGKLDLVVQSQFNGTQALLNNGDGTFPAARSITTTYQPAQVAARDLDGDGALDVIVAGYNSSAQIFFNDGHGGLLAPIDEPGVISPSIVLVGDIDGNGKPDVVIPDRVDPHKAAVWLNQGNRNFASSVVSLPLDAAISVLVDVNHDGVRDLVAADDTQLAVLTYQSNGTFAVDSTTLITAAAGIVAGDVNHDGSQDVVVSRQTGATTFIGNGAASWAAQVDNPSASTGALALGDVDGDGKLDLAAVNGLMLGHGDGSFGPPISNGSPFGAPILLRDIDGDGRLDLIVVLSTRVFVGRGNGDGTFRAASYATGSARTVAIADLDIDGRPDLVSATSGVPGSGNDLELYMGRCIP